ncbi:DUF2982 domain-containing protein [Vibrio sp.]|uniref:DUF2982 domain-containing protein n=1 Tax=Vibrio viridaestus TaxID=2487322 RepID=A0A3N9U5Y6_9VIBR|nr:DUF2982 domain-containing protein [Vibrio viridaestus]MDC0612350.1 DUF2982 domain-containing protein [Vibrio sp.]RQW63476.1 DUF2982 domain-containing protein [Vibrio viridaestus]
MKTVHVANFEFDPKSRRIQIILLLYTIISLSVVMFAATFTLAVFFTVILSAFGLFTYWLVMKSQVRYTLTPTHFQQHLFKGGWVVKWNNISRIDICTYQNQGWHQPLPWIGIRLKHYSPFLNSICPRIISELLLSQRGLLYLGMKQSGSATKFEDIVLDPTTFVAEDGKRYKGLLAMLANRMKYQRQYHGYDIFISVADLDRKGDEFVGLSRRFLAAAEPDRTLY